jgi:amino acid adenylation domain-containing protein
LFLIEITGIEIIRTTFCVGGLPGWWLGADEGRDLHPGMSTEQWDSKLQDTGFSGVDLVFHDIPDAKQHTMSFIASQAVDDTVQLLREPLECLAEGPELKSLVVVGGKTLPISKAVNALKRLLGPAYSSRITIASDVESIDFSRAGNRADFICLQELDGSLFAKEVTPKTLKALQTMIVGARNVLWVTTGRRTKNPYANMMVGMARAISKELPHVKMQFLDLDTTSSPTSVARTTLETFLRMHILASHDHEASPLLWPQEPELLVEGSDTLIPRLRPDKLLNDRYNAKFRVISKSVNSSDIPISFTRQREKLALTESVPQPHAQSSEAPSVRVQYSLFVPGEKEDSICFSIGRLASSNAFVIAVAAKQASIISVPEENVASIDEVNCNPVYLQRMVNQIAMAGLFSSIENGGSALLHNPTESLAAAFVAEARKHDVQPLCASSNTVVPEGWMKIHPQSPARVLKHLLPQDINIYLDASTSPDLRSSSITSALPRSCKLYQWDSSLVQRGLLSASSIKEAIRAACSNLSEHSTTAHCDTRVLNIEDIATTEASILNHTYIVNWVSARPLKLIVQPPDTTVLFDSAKTHLMIGMAGGLGLSVCGWALQHGIKEMVITSRMPNINAEWLLQARNQGARVHVRSLDASDRPSLDSLISNIRETLPPLGGVCNAAMVLSDKLFVDLDVDAITETFKPKVNVSRYLNEILADVPLDYFVMFSSALSQIGGQGSSNYHAANLYMAGLAAQRRQNGRPGSVIHIGYVTDVGYFMRVDQSSRDYIGRMQIVPLSETDVHHAFAEALRAGRPGSERSCEVGLGIEPLDAMIEDQEPVWAADPLFAHFLPSTNSHDKTDGAQFGRDDIKKLIQEAETDAEVVDIVQEALCAKIETMLQLPTGSVDADALLTELGIDSLVAVEIRAWFSKKVGIDVPVVKILGRSSLLQICQDATEEVNATKVKETPKTAESEPGSSSDSQNMSDSSDAEGPSSGTVSPPPSTEGESIELGDEKLEMVRTTAQEEQRSDSKAVVELAEPTPDFYQSLINSGRMSAAQSRIYVLNYLMNDPTAYSLMIRYDIEDNLDIDRLKNALTTTMQHHEALRTCYFAHEDLDQPTQGLLSFPVRRFKHVPNATDKDIDEELNAIRTKVWDIEHGETMSLTVLSRDARTHILILGYHHIILDASGMRRFIEDLNFAYNRRTLKMLGKTCIDFAAREQEGLRSGALNKNFQYWREQFTPLPELLPLLPMAKTTVRPETKQIVSVHASREIDEDAVIKVKQMCQVLGVTAFQFHLAVVQVLLAQLLGLDDLCIGVADANRPDTDFMDTVGFFLNLLPVRFHLPADTTFAQVAQNTARQMGAAFENSVPFDMLLDQLNIARSATHTPLFQVLVNYRLAMTQSIPFGNSHLHIVDGEEGRNPYDITFSFLESHTKGLGITMDCMDSLYDVAGIESILDMYIELLTSILRDIHVPVSDCQVYSAEAVSAALELGSGDYREISGPATLAEKFQLVQQSFKDRVAIQDRSSELKYHELATRVNFIAATILDADQKAGSRVAVLCEPSVDFIASLLAILHIGAIYVPLDVSLPSSRHAEIISSSDLSLIICHQATRESATQLVGENMANLHILELDNIKSMHEAVPCSADADSPAFLLFTSGTTGKPKGVTLSQGNVINWLAHAIPADKFDVTQTSVLQQSSFGFDMSLLQSFCALMSGGRLVIVPQDIRKDPPQIAKLIYEKNVSWTFGVPSEYLLWLRYGREYLRQCKGWRIARIGGEFFPVQLKREIKRLELPNLSISDNYGPTEITFTVTSRTVSLEIEKTIASGSNIGKAHHNYAICILDASGRPVPQGFRGEICIGGPGIAQGYWDMPVETDKKFIADPTAGIGNRKATTNRWYRTGDQGKLAPDGSVIFIGRLGGDTQVKLRGQRIELAEIEGALLNAGDALLSTAVVTVRDGDLIAHVIPNRGKLVDREVIQSKMMTGLNLPQYMHPARVIVVEDLPRSNTGKIDRQAVLKLSLVTSHDDDDEDGASDLTLREHELKVLWSRVLPDPYQKLTAESDFFLEGGNSLRLTKLQNEIKETLGIFVSARELYGTPTLRQMAARIGSDTVSDDDIDWSVEIAIPEDLMAAAREVPKVARTPKTKDLEILLTGAAGVLGNYILHHLLENPAVAKVHCIAIATEDEERIPTSDKVQTYFGSLASNELGLTESELETLKSSIDVVIHAGANGHCLNSYGSIRKPNVESTQFLASLCLPRSVPFLYLSSQRVPAMAGLKTLPPVPVLAEPAKTGDTGYMASRWVSERFLHKFSEHNNFLTEIHRPCLFFGDRAPPSDALNGVLRYTRLMRAVPHFAKVEGYVDIKEADDIARDIVASAIAMAGSSSTGVHFRHHSSGRKVTMEEWPGYMGELTGETFEVLELPDWIARARKAGIHPLIATYLEGVVEKEELGLFPYLGEELEEE